MFDMSVFDTPVTDEVYDKLKATVERTASGDEKQGATKLDPSAFSTKDMTCLAAILHDEPGAQLYGHMMLYFEYKKHIFKIFWRIHTPNMKRAILANSPLNIQEMVWVKDEELDFEYWNLEDTTFGIDAWLSFTPTRTLTDSDLYVRLAFEKIKAWSVENQMCKKLRKTDRLHLKLKAEKERI